MKQVNFILIVSMLFTSCYSDNEEDLYGPVTCDVSNVTFTTDILPIVNNSCNMSGCHDTQGSAPGNFTTYTDIKTKVDNGSFANRVLVQKNMPPSGPLSSCDQEKIKKWIADGAPNN